MTSPETPTYQPQPVENQLAELPDQRESKVAKAGDTLALTILRLSDRIEQRKLDKLSAKADQNSSLPEDELLESSAEHTVDQESGEERESLGRKLLKAIGAGAGKALQRVGEFKTSSVDTFRPAAELIVGSTILGARGVKTGAEKVSSAAQTIGAEYKADFNDLKTEALAAIEKRKDAAATRKAERAEGRAEKRQKRQDEALELQRQIEAAAAERAEAAAERKNARRQKWADRKDALRTRIDGAIDSAATGIEAATDKTLQFSRDQKESAVNMYESSIDAAAELKRKAQEKATSVASTAAEFGRDTAEKSRRGAEWMKTHSDNVRAIGRAGLDASKQEYRDRYPTAQAAPDVQEAA